MVISECVLYVSIQLLSFDLVTERNRSQFIIPNVKTVNHGFVSLRYLGPKIWETILPHLKDIDSLKN